MFHHQRFSDAKALLRLKKSQKISVCIPTLNEAGTIGEIVGIIRESMVEMMPLIDEILVIDSDSTDGTRDIASANGARVYRSREIAPEFGTYIGKGENLWKALHVAKGDIICYIDGDISNFHPGFITGLIGPLLADPEIDYVKAYYERPFQDGWSMQKNGGGRVSEILVRPLLSLFYPELTSIFQPLAGEYAARRNTLESLPFPVGYGVEIAHLIDLAAAGKLGRIAQVDLDQRAHRNRPDPELGQMSFAIIRTVFRRLERDGLLNVPHALPDFYRSWAHHGKLAHETLIQISDAERPPFKSLTEIEL